MNFILLEIVAVEILFCQTLVGNGHTVHSAGPQQGMGMIRHSKSRFAWFEHLLILETTTLQVLSWDQ